MSQEGNRLFGVPIEILKYALYEAVNSQRMDWFLELQEEEQAELRERLEEYSQFSKEND